jgi:hypothetical protein
MIPAKAIDPGIRRQRRLFDNALDVLATPPRLRCLGQSEGRLNWAAGRALAGRARIRGVSCAAFPGGCAFLHRIRRAFFRKNLANRTRSDPPILGARGLVLAADHSYN